jgi:hypothetical protein
LRRHLGGATESETLRLLLWRADTFLRLGADLDAEAEVTDVLNIAPDMTPDAQCGYTLTLVALVSDLRSKLPPAASVIVNGLPPGGTVTVDGRAVGRAFRVLQGRQTLALTAPGGAATSKRST